MHHMALEGGGQFGKDHRKMEKVGWESERRDRGRCTLPPLGVVSW